MNILFLSMVNIRSLKTHGIYEDCLREFVKRGHTVYAVTPTERRNGENTTLIEETGAKLLKVRTGNLQKTNLLEKGVATLMVEGQFIRAIKKYFKGVKFDLVLYSTPPITFAKVVAFVKKRDGARSYLMLKDIFPQNAVDLGMLKKTGLKGVIYKFFRRKEKRLYALSDTIGCMSEANVKYVLANNPEVDKNKVEICPNCVEIRDLSVSNATRTAMREKYGLPQDKRIFVYGGNLGKPQGIDFLIECLRSQKQENAFFLIVGDGTEYGKLEAFIQEEHPQNVTLMKRLPKEDYDKLVSACDIGMICLDKRFTIPNFPSRLLAYMQAKLPVLCCTDENTDVGAVATAGGFGWSCVSDKVEAFLSCVQNALKADVIAMGENAYAYLQAHYSAETAYTVIMEGNRV